MPCGIFSTHGIIYKQRYSHNPVQFSKGCSTPDGWSGKKKQDWYRTNPAF
jgi:hypothetical protein